MNIAKIRKAGINKSSDRKKKGWKTIPSALSENG